MGIISLSSLLALVLILAYLLWPRCNLYEYVEILRIRWPVLIGRVRRDGTLLDLTKPWGMRRVGQFYIRDHKGILRLYNLSQGDRQGEDAGDVAPLDPAPVTATGGLEVGKVERQGWRRWWDGFLRLHAPVLPEEIPPTFRVTEYGRFRPATSNVVTLLSKGGAALLLYREWGSAETLPYRDPVAKWDTALPAAFLFGLLNLPLAVRLWFWNHPYQFLDRWSSHAPVNSLAPGFTAFVGIWALLYLLKRFLLSVDDRVLDYLILFNRATGLPWWAPIGLVLSIVLAVLSLWRQEQRAFIPLYAAAAVGFLAVYLFAPGDAWPVKPRGVVIPPLTPSPAEWGDGDKRYSWTVDGGFRMFELKARIPFGKDEIGSIREQNPFQQDPDQAQQNYPASVKQIVSLGRESRQALAAASVVAQTVRDHELSHFETVQAVLGLAQEPTITYMTDTDCEEIGNREYCRLAGETLWDGHGDCDCKSALTATVLKALGFPVLVLLSDRAKHAAVAVGGIPAEMPREGLLWFEYQGEVYYFCETTGAGWRVGQPSELSRTVVKDKSGIVDVN
jgi:hypothetical protein